MRVAAAGLTVVVSLAMGACGDGDDEQVRVESPSTTTSPPTSEGNGLALTLRWEPEPLVAGAAATFRLSVANISDGRIALKSSSGQQAELTLLRGEDEVYRWSRGRAFTQAITLLPIDAGSTEEILLDEPALDVEPGSYRLVATLVAEPAAPPVETVVEVGEA